ncbi:MULTISPECIES: hypothetical protein [Amycolatopsis]|uniref:O-antigen/teichoic acid export membrane protein n=1 Tax=Amycolatopsis tucumanensis TaxID=401106 RepID=A0ABP7I1A6_9PSEU|nr:hypothetical protein [Amycolatopsis tucumanensis]MCF6422989.1 hypothetical protein [Amycolatopsis tucumanensis]
MTTTGRHRKPAAKPSGLRAMAGRLSWGLGDQAVSSLTNFAVGIYVARELGVTAFGIFSLAWVTYGVLINISRGLATDPLMVRFSGVDTGVWRAAVARSSATALAVGALAGLLSVVFGIVVGGSLGPAFVALGVILPALLLQDSWRFAFFASGEGRKAFVNDALWGVAMIPAMVLADLHGSVVAFLLAWGGAAAVAAGYGYLQTGLRPSLDGVRSWLHDQRDLGPRYLVENVSNSGGSQIRMYGLGAIAGVAAVGTVRGGELLLGPFVAVLMGLAFVAVPEAARVVRRNVRRLPTFALLLGGSQALGALLWGGALLLVLNDRLGELVLGDVWHTAEALIIPATLSVFNASFIGGAATGLRALGAAKRSMRCQLVASALYVIGGLSGAAIGGAVGSGWGVACATFAGAFVWWSQLHVAVREHVPEEARTP